MVERNYIVTTVDVYKKLKVDIIEGTLQKYVQEQSPEAFYEFGIMVAVPAHIDLRDTDAIFRELDNPTKLGGNPLDWKLYIVKNTHNHSRNRSMVELLFCMLRSKHNYSNQC